MGVFRRICILIFSLAGICTLAALGLAWVGPWQQEAQALILQNDLYFQVLEVLFCITATGLLVDLLRGLFTRNRKTVLVTKEGGDEVSVSRDAIASQATHVIEEDGRFVAKRVSVKAKKRGHVRVYARVQPAETVDVTSAGEELHQRLDTGLEKICGEKVDSVRLEFVDAQEYVPEGGSPVSFAPVATAEPLAPAPAPVADDEAGEDEPAQAVASEGITVPIRHQAHEVADEGADLPVVPAEPPALEDDEPDAAEDELAGQTPAEDVPDEGEAPAPLDATVVRPAVAPATEGEE